MQEIVKLKREVSAIQVPFGTSCTLPKDTEVNIIYSLGGTYTVTTLGDMYRIANHDADALGKTIQEATSTTSDNTVSLENKVWSVLRTCYDPEIPVNIVDLGLIYSVDVATPDSENRSDIIIRMTLTAPGCGMGPIIAEDAKQKVSILPEIKSVTVDIVFDPPWDRSIMSDQAKLELGLF